jgi:hypothetical protein
VRRECHVTLCTSIRQEGGGCASSAHSARGGWDGTKSSLSKMMYDILSNPKLQFQLKEDKQKVKERRYHLRRVEATSTHNVKMKAVGFEKKGRYGIGSHYCFTGDPILGLRIATCCFFCSCVGCKNELSSPTVSTRYSGPFDECKYWSLFKINDTRGWNDTKILSFAPAKDCDAEEMEETLVATLKQLAKTISLNVVIGGVGAYVVDDDVDQITW